MPLSADEGVVTVVDAKRLIAADAADVFSIKVTKMGGIRPAKQICEYAEAHGIRVFFNSMIEEGITEAASIAVAATVKNPVEEIGHAFFSPLRLSGDICDYYKNIHVSEGETWVPKGPGLGVVPDPAAISKYLVKRETVR